MHARTTRTIALTCLIGFTTTTVARADGMRYWGQWRGPLASGVAPHGDPPVDWSETQNIRWKVKLPGGGHATPVVWGDRVYVQVAIKSDKSVEQPADEVAAGADGENAEQPRGRGGSRRGDGERGGRGAGRAEPPRSAAPTHAHQFAVLALDRKSGETVWQKVVCEKLPHEGGHTDASQASNSPITDGERLYAYFGSRGLYCLDAKSGEVLWEKQFGEMHTRHEFGEGSSPVLHGDTIVVNWDHEGDSFIIALDAKSGSERWRQARDEVTSWDTPLVVTGNGKPEVIVTASNRVRAYDLATGKLIWECGGLGTNCIPSPVALDGVVYAMSGHREKNLLAIRYIGANGDLTGTEAVVWQRDSGIPYVPSPLLYDDTLYLLERTNGILSVVHARTGKDRYERQRLEKIEGVYASPVGAADRVYVVGRNGVTKVLAHGAEFKELATNKLDDGFEASPVIVDNELYLRGREHLYCVARSDQ
jgi:outer membrane protein assembly factor BamB